MIDIKKTLSDLKIKDINNGSSTGSKSLSGEIINSYSPVDGKLIGLLLVIQRQKKNIKK